jgi:hypothetical protein
VLITETVHLQLPFRREDLQEGGEGSEFNGQDLMLRSKDWHTATLSSKPGRLDLQRRLNGVDPPFHVVVLDMELFCLEQLLEILEQRDDFDKVVARGRLHVCFDEVFSLFGVFGALLAGARPSPLVHHREPSHIVLVRTPQSARWTLCPKTKRGFPPQCCAGLPRDALDETVMIRVRRSPELCNRPWVGPRTYPRSLGRFVAAELV